MDRLPSLELLELRDLDQLPAVYPGWRLGVVQTDLGRVLGTTSVLAFADLTIVRNVETRGSVSDYAIPDATTAFAFVAAGTAPASWCGVEVPDAALLINPSGRDYLVAVQGRYDAVTILVANRLLTERCLLPEAYLRAGDVSTRWLVPLGPPGERLRRWLVDLFDSVEALRALARDPLAAGSLRDRVLNALAAVLDAGLDGASRQPTARAPSRYGLIRRAHDLIETRLGEPLGADDLARELGVSPRVLRYAFQGVLQISPYQYMLKRKLLGVRRQLRDRGSAASVSQVALDHGFGELGRFSRYYRRMFGELPSVTWARRPG